MTEGVKECSNIQCAWYDIVSTLHCKRGYVPANCPDFWSFSATDQTKVEQSECEPEPSCETCLYKIRMNCIGDTLCGDYAKNSHAGAMDSTDHPVDQHDMVRGKVLKKALETINGDRQDSYGNPEDSFRLIAKYWNVYLIEVQKKILIRNGFDLDNYDLVDLLTPRGVAEMMTLFKIARMSGQKPHIDNYVDSAGYIGIAADMLDRETK